MSLKYIINKSIIRVLQLVCGFLVRLSGVQMPKHVAIIMDGNRRYARQAGMKLEVGYNRGHGTLIRIMKCCTLVSVRELTVFAFSIENFKRSEEEVASIMQLASDKFTEIFDKLSAMHLWGVRVRIVGRQELLSPELRAMGARLALATQHNKVLQLNIAFPYTGRDEISRAASHIVDGVKSSALRAEDVDCELVSRALEVGPVDLLLRTSGETRLSDFMLWQVSHTVLYFTKTLWPDFSVWELLAAIFHYWRHAPPQARTQTHEHTSTQGHNKHKRGFIHKLQETRRRILYKRAAIH